MSNASSSKQVKQSTGQAGKGGAGNNSNSMKMFQNSQKTLKIVLEDDIERFLSNKIQSRLLFEQSRADELEEGWNLYKKLRKKEIEQYKEEQMQQYDDYLPNSYRHYMKRKGMHYSSGGGHGYSNNDDGGNITSHYDTSNPNDKDLIDWGNYDVNSEYGEFEQNFKPQTENLVERSKVRVTIPGVPDDEKIEAWYAQGILKYKELIKMLAGHNGVSTDIFEEAPKLSLKDINGIKPEPAKTTSTSKK